MFLELALGYYKHYDHMMIIIYVHTIVIVSSSVSHRGQGSSLNTNLRDKVCFCDACNAKVPIVIHRRIDTCTKNSNKKWNTSNSETRLIWAVSILKTTIILIEYKLNQKMQTLYWCYKTSQNLVLRKPRSITIWL